MPGSLTGFSSPKKAGFDKLNAFWRTRTDYNLMAAVKVKSLAVDLREEIAAKDVLVQLWEKTLLNDEDCYRCGGEKPSKLSFQAAKGITSADFVKRFLAENPAALQVLGSSLPRDDFIEALETFWWQRTEQWHRLFKANRMKALRHWLPVNRSAKDGTPLEQMVSGMNNSQQPRIV